MKTAEELQQMDISDIASLIFSDWKAQLKPGQQLRQKAAAAYPYMDAMLDLHGNLNEARYINDTGKTIVLYFLGNAAQYKGEQAKLIKAELKRRLKDECGYKY